MRYNATDRSVRIRVTITGRCYRPWPRPPRRSSVSPFSTTAGSEARASPPADVVGMHGVPLMQHLTNAAVAVPEHPPVLPGGVELAEVPLDDPGFRLVRAAVLRPLLGELPQVAIQGGEHLLGHHSPVVGGPSPHDRRDRAGMACAFVPRSARNSRASLLRIRLMAGLLGLINSLSEDLVGMRYRICRSRYRTRRGRMCTETLVSRSGGDGKGGRGCGALVDPLSRNCGPECDSGIAHPFPSEATSSCGTPPRRQQHSARCVT